MHVYRWSAANVSGLRLLLLPLLLLRCLADNNNNNNNNNNKEKKNKFWYLTNDSEIQKMLTWFLSTS
jgi:hypothetical protein